MESPAVEEVTDCVMNFKKSFIENLQKKYEEDITKLSPFSIFKNDCSIGFDNLHANLKRTNKSNFIESHLKFSDKTGLEFLREINDTVKRYLIVGSHSIGKTFHFHKILYHYSVKKDILQDYVVLAADLTKSSFNTFKTLQHQIWYQIFDKELSEEEENFYFGFDNKHVQDKVIILIDGLDESQILSNEKYWYILYRKYSTNFSIIAWIRDIKPFRWYDNFDMILEIVGFEPTHLLQYFNKIFNNAMSSSNSICKEENCIENLFVFLKEKRQNILKYCKFPMIAEFTIFLWIKENFESIKLWKIHDLIIDYFLEEKNTEIDKGQINSLKEIFYEMAYNKIFNKKTIPYTKDFKKSQKNENFLTRDNQTYIMQHSKVEKVLNSVNISYLEYGTAQFIVQQYKNANYETIQNYLEHISLTDDITHDTLIHILDFIKDIDVNIWQTVKYYNIDLYYLEMRKNHNIFPSFVSLSSKDLMGIIKIFKCKNIKLEKVHFQMKDLTTIIQRNNLEIYNLTIVKCFNISFTFNTLSILFKINCLKSLNFEYCKYQYGFEQKNKFSISICNLKNLVLRSCHLNWVFCKYLELHDLPYLEYLDLSDNRITGEKFEIQNN